LGNRGGLLIWGFAGRRAAWDAGYDTPGDLR
jgi:hypothetical protein